MQEGTYRVEDSLMLNPALAPATLLSNLSFNRTANGVSPWPRGSVVHHLPRGQGATPSSAG